jgi:hypothetical protein
MYTVYHDSDNGFENLAMTIGRTRKSSRVGRAPIRLMLSRKDCNESV